MSNREKYIEKLKEVASIVKYKNLRADLTHNSYLQSFFGEMSDEDYDINYHEFNEANKKMTENYIDNVLGK